MLTLRSLPVLFSIAALACAPAATTPADPDPEPAESDQPPADDPEPAAEEPRIDAPVADPREPIPPPEGDCIKLTKPGHHIFECDADLTWDVEVPDGCDEGGCGLILDMHGWTMTADKEDLNTTMRALGTEHGFVVLQPTAPGLSGGDEIPTWVFDEHPAPVFTVVEEAAEMFQIDPKRRHATGFSQGGHMTWRMLCQHASFWASVAPLAGVKGCAFDGDDMPVEEVDILVVFGRDDAILKFDENGQWQVDQALAAWPFGAGEVIDESEGHLATRYTTDSGTVLEFWEHDYKAQSMILAGHCFPGSDDVGPGINFGCAEADTFHLGQLVMDFFLAHPRP